MSFMRAMLCFLALATVILPSHPAAAAPVGVRFVEGSLHGFIVLRTVDGEPLHDIKQPQLYVVTSLAFDASTRTLFYTVDNNAYRDIVALDVDTKRQRTLIKDGRIGELVFDRCYQGNPLVNVLCLGLLPVDRLVLGQASGPGNLAVLVILFNVAYGVMNARKTRLLAAKVMTIMQHRLEPHMTEMVDVIMRKKPPQ